MKFKIMIMVMLCLCVNLNLAYASPSKSVNIEATLSKASQEFRLPKDVIQAIAWVESGGNPWALNVAGKGFVFTTKKEAIKKAQEAQASGLSFDVGVMQINSWWLDRYQISLEAAFDPVVNVYFGGWILKQELIRLGSVRKAVGAYHSPNASRADQYANRIMAVLNQRPSVSAPASGGSKNPATSNSKPKSIQVPEPRKPVPMIVQSTGIVQSMKVQKR